MSRIGQKPIEVPPGITVELKESLIKVSGPLGKLQMNCHPLIKVQIYDSKKEILVKNENEVVIRIDNPPYGLQLEKNNWNFLIQTILGYLWTLNNNLKIRGTKSGFKYIVIIYSE